jgi:hypothetical protein
VCGKLQELAELSSRAPILPNNSSAHKQQYLPMRAIAQTDPEIVRRCHVAHAASLSRAIHMLHNQACRVDFHGIELHFNVSLLLR